MSMYEVNKNPMQAVDGNLIVVALLTGYIAVVGLTHTNPIVT